MVPLVFADDFKTGDEPSTVRGTILREADIPCEEPSENRRYTQLGELEKLSESRFSKAVDNFSWDDEITLEKGASTTGITRTEIFEANGERFARAFDASGEMVGVRKLLVSGLLE